MDRQEFKNKVIQKIRDFDAKDHSQEQEDDICRAYLMPLFSYLGWKVEDTDEVKGQRNQPQGRPDYIFYLNDRIAFYLEAKKIKDHDPLTDEDVKQAINYARNKNKRWAVLSNFKETIILICDIKENALRRHIFKKIKIEELKTDDRLFDDLLLLSRESFETEKIEGKAEEEGRIKESIKIDEELLDDILSWRNKLVKAIKNPKNHNRDYSKDTVDDIVQTLLNRIIFIRTAEDRRLEAKPDETIKAILNQYETNKYTVIRNKINNLFEEYDAVYDSKLFTYDDSHPESRHLCEKVIIDDKTYYNILKQTYAKNELYTYNFAYIDADILGSVYEKYIGTIQKATGSYYTPTYIVEYIVNSTVKELLTRKNMTNIKVADIACGSGSFLLKTFDLVDDFYKEKNVKSSQAELEVRDNTNTITRQIRVLRNNIFAVDLDNKALEIAQLNLLLRIAETRHRLPDLRNNLKCGNSIVVDDAIAKGFGFKWDERFANIIQFNQEREVKEGSGFDIVIGNPPWVSFGLRGVGKLPIEESEYYRQNFKSAQYKLSTYALFLEQAIKLTKEEGRVGYILPDSFLLGEYFSKLRRYVLDNCKIISITLFMFDVFKEKATTGRNVIIILEKDTTKPKKNRVKVVKVERNPNKNLTFTEYAYSQDYFESSPLNRFRLFFDKESKLLIENIEKGSEELGIYFHGRTGIRSLIGQKKILSKTNNGALWKRGLISGSEIGRYWLKYNGNYINVDPKLLNKGGWDAQVISNPKLLVRQTADRLFATYDDKGYYHFNNIHSFNARDNTLDLKYVLALLNSKLLNAYYILTTLEKNRVMAQTDIETLEKLPIKIIDQTKQKPFVELANKILEINEEISKAEEGTNKKRTLEIERDKLLDKMDSLVYTLYGITQKSELDIINEAIK